MIEKICSEEISNRKRFERKTSANTFEFTLKKFNQYYCNPVKSVGFRDIPEGTDYFELRGFSIGAIRKYVVEAKDSDGGTLRTFHYQF